MNLRPLYTILISFCIAILLIIGLYYYGHNSDTEEHSPNFKNTTIQLLPRPIILDDHSNTPLKNTALENLLTAKSDKVISITETTIDFSNIISNLPFNLQKMSMHFHYNKTEDRVDFEGQTNRRYQSLEISGHYKHTLYNQIHYVINISSDSNELNVNALYTPSTKENSIDSLTGQFIMKTNSSTLLKHLLHKEDMSITGNFYKTDNILKFDKITLSSNTINVNADAEITNNNMLYNVVISDTNINDLEKNINLPELYNEIFERFPQITKAKSAGSITLQNVSYDTIKIEEGILKITTGNDKFLLEKLALVTAENIKILSKGNIIHTPFALEYDGALNVTNLSTDAANHFIKLDNNIINQDRDIEVTAKIKLSPPLIHLTDFKIIQGFTEVDSELKQYNYTNSTITNISSNIRNYRQSNKALSFLDIILKKYNQIPKISVTKDSTENFTHAKLNLNNFYIQDNLHIDNISTTYIKIPNNVQLGNIETHSPNLNINGEIAFDFKNDPQASIQFKGDKSDAFALYSLIGNSMLNCKQLKDCKGFLQNITKFKGKIAFDIEGTAHGTTPISSLNCSADIDTNLNLKQCTAVLFDGNLVMNGNIHMGDNIKYSINYELLKADAQLLVKKFITDKIKLEGYFNDIKGFFTSYGLDKETFITHLNGNVAIKTPHVKITKLNLRKLINKHHPYDMTQTNTKAKAKPLKQNNSEDWFDINNLDTKFTIQDGTAQSSHFFFDTNHKIKTELFELKYGIFSDYLSSLMKLSYPSGHNYTANDKFSVNGTLKDISLNARPN